MTGCDHEHSEIVTLAARWLADQPAGSVVPVVPALRSRFELTVPQACEAAALAHRYRTLRGAFA